MLNIQTNPATASSLTGNSEVVINGADLGISRFLKSLLALTMAMSVLGSVFNPAVAQFPFRETFDSYDNDVDPDVTPSGFSESPGQRWFVQDAGSGKVYRHAQKDVNELRTTINSSISFSVVTIPEVSGNDFSVSCSVAIQESVTEGDARNNAENGVVILGGGPFNPGYKGAIDVANSGIGTIHIKRNSSIEASALFPDELKAGKTYDLSFKAIQTNGGALALEFSMTDGVSSVSASFEDPSPLTGSRFGFENILTTYPGGTSVSLMVDYDNLSIAAPSQFSQPKIASIRVNQKGQIELQLADLAVGKTTLIQGSRALDNPVWETVSSFKATEPIADTTEAMEPGNRFFRLKTVD